MEFVDCLMISLGLIATSLMITIVVRSFLDKEEKGLYVTKLIISVLFNSLFLWLVSNCLTRRF